jgi:hypothetical protein
MINWSKNLEIMILKAYTDCFLCWPEEASSGTACPCYSSLIEVDLLYLGKGQECRANTNSHRSWSDVFSWQRMHWDGRHYCSVYSILQDCRVYMPIHTLYLQLCFLLNTKGSVCMGRTLFPSIVSITLPWMNKKNLHLNNPIFNFLKRWRKMTWSKTLEKTSGTIHLYREL